jgi:hypothetical protein
MIFFKNLRRKIKRQKGQHLPELIILVLIFVALALTGGGYFAGSANKVSNDLGKDISDIKVESTSGTAGTTVTGGFDKDTGTRTETGITLE